MAFGNAFARPAPSRRRRVRLGRILAGGLLGSALALLSLEARASDGPDPSPPTTSGSSASSATESLTPEFSVSESSVSESSAGDLSGEALEDDTCVAPALDAEGAAEGDRSCAPPEETWEVNPEVARNVEEILGDARRFRYCHEPGYRLWPHEKQTYCQDRELLSQRCPELARACERPAFGRHEGEFDFDFDLIPNLEWLGGAAEVLRVLFWIVLALGVGFLLRALLRNLAEEMARRKGLEEPQPEVVEWTPETPEAPKETDVERLLGRAREDARRGDFAGACAAAYAAALRALEHRQLLELHRSRTNGDYLRQLGAHPAEREKLRELVREVETIQFGHVTPDRTRFDRILERVLALVGPTVSLLLLVVATGLLGGCSDAAPLPDAPGAPGGPDGYGLLESLLQRHSASAQRRMRRVTGSLDEVTTFVALSPSLRPEEWDHLMSWVARGGTLIAAGVPPDLARHLEHEPKHTPCLGRPSAPGLELAQAGANTFVAFPESSTLVSCGDAPFLVAMDYGEGAIYALADTMWLRNANLAAADNAQIVVGLAAAPEGRVELLGPWTGSGSHHPLESIHNAGLTPWLVQLLLLALAYAVARGVRFGSPVEPRREQRRSFVEHAEALANQYARARASGHALEQYGRWALERIRERVPVRERDLHALAHAVARRTGGEPMAILKVLVEAQSAGQVQGAPEEHLRTMEALSRILRDVGGA